MANLVLVHAHLLGLGVIGSLVNLDSPGYYIHWHFIQISAANLIVIGLMLVVFIVALLARFPGHRSRKEPADG